MGGSLDVVVCKISIPPPCPLWPRSTTAPSCFRRGGAPSRGAESNKRASRSQAHRGVSMLIASQSSDRMPEDVGVYSKHLRHEKHRTSSASTVAKSSRQPYRHLTINTTQRRAEPYLKASDTPSQRVHLCFAVPRGEDHFAQFPVRTCSVHVLGHARGDIGRRPFEGWARE